MRSVIRRPSERGEAMLEFAFAAPILLLLTFGAMDLSRVFRTSMIVSGAAQAGAHYAISTDSAAGDDAGIISAAGASAGNPASLTTTVTRFCTCGTSTLEVSCSSTCNGLGTWVRVSSKMPFKTISDVPGLGPTLDISDSAVVRTK